MNRLVHLLLAFLVGVATTARAQDGITTEGVVEAPVAEVWKAWTTTAGLAAWLAPHADVDLRLDGRLRTHYDPKGTLGDARTIENRILAYEPERMLSIRVAQAPNDFPFRERVGEMWTVLHFQPTADRKTTLRIVGLGFSGDAEAQKMRAFFQRGNDYTLAQMQKHFAKR